MNSDLPPWEPAAMISREEIIKTDKAVRELPDIRIAAREDIFRIKVLGMDWDIGAMIYEPEDRAKIHLWLHVPPGRQRNMGCPFPQPADAHLGGYRPVCARRHQG